MQRWTKDRAYLTMAQAIAKRSTCLDKQVGCVITNHKDEVIAVGYNGAPRGYPHCIDVGFCKKEKYNNPAKCPSAHAEQNAILQCRVPEQIFNVYLTLSPCINCVRILMNTPCRRIVFIEEHKHTEPMEMWHGEWRQYYL